MSIDLERTTTSKKRRPWDGQAETDDLKSEIEELGYSRGSRQTEGRGHDDGSPSFDHVNIPSETGTSLEKLKYNGTVGKTYVQI